MMSRLPASLTDQQWHRAALAYQMRADPSSRLQQRTRYYVLGNNGQALSVSTAALPFVQGLVRPFVGGCY